MLGRCWALTALLFVTLNGSASRGQVPERRFAFLVGINDYDHRSIKDLNYAVSDMTALRTCLLRAGFDEVMLLCDDDPKHPPTKDSVQWEMRRFLDKVGPKDFVLVAFACHGINIGRESFLCPKDMDAEILTVTTEGGEKKTLKPVKNSLVPMRLVYDMLDADRKDNPCRAKFALHKLVMIDACRTDESSNGGDGVARGGPGTSRSMIRRSITEVSGGLAREENIKTFNYEQPPRDVFVMSSCRDGQPSLEEARLGHGIFTHFIIRGIETRKAIIRSDQTMTAGDLFDFASGQVVAHLRNDPENEGVQDPEARGSFTKAPNFGRIVRRGTDQFRGKDLRSGANRREFLDYLEQHKNDLDFADLSNANLSGMDLPDLRLMSAKLAGTILKGTNLEGARMVKTSLVDADLRGANLRDSFLGGAVFERCLLDDADFEGANTRGAVFRRSNTEQAKNLH